MRWPDVFCQSMSSQTTGSAAYDFLGWIETNKNIVIIGALALVVVGVGLAVAARNAENKAVEADSALLKLRVFERGDGRPAADATDFLRVASSYSKTPAAERANLLAARAYYDKADYAKAKAEYEKFLQSYPNHAAADLAAFGLAASLEASGDPNGALKAYQEVVDRYKQSGLEGQARLALARIYEAQGKHDLALRTYDDLTKSAAMMTLMSEVLNRKERLLADHPELAPTNAASEFITTNFVSGPSAPAAAPKETSAPGTPGGPPPP